MNLLLLNDVTVVAGVDCPSSLLIKERKGGSYCDGVPKAQDPQRLFLPISHMTHPPHSSLFLSYLPSQPTYHYLSFNNIIIRVLLLAVQFYIINSWIIFFFLSKLKILLHCPGIKLCWQGIQPYFEYTQVHKNFLI